VVLKVSEVWCECVISDAGSSGDANLGGSMGGRDRTIEEAAAVCDTRGFFAG
jgi:hypothetical protein